MSDVLLLTVVVLALSPVLTTLTRTIADDTVRCPASRELFRSRS